MRYKMLIIKMLPLILLLMLLMVECESSIELNVVYKRLKPVELSENVVIGSSVVHLKQLIADEISSNNEVIFDNFYFNFEFINNMSEWKLMSNYFNGDELINVNNSLLVMSKYFLIDRYTGSIFTSKSLDLENFCDTNLCQKRLASSVKSSQEVDDDENDDQADADDDEYDEIYVDDYMSSSEANANLKHKNNLSKLNNQRNLFNISNCVLKFAIKATKYMRLHRHKRSVNEREVDLSNQKDSVYYITFDLILKDVDEFNPVFEQSNPVIFNVTEEMSPLRLPLGKKAFDNDCSERQSLTYGVRILKVNNLIIQDFLKTKASNNNRGYDEFGQLSRNQTRNNIFDFRIVTDVDQKNLFLYLTAPIDREQVQSIELNVLAMSGAYNKSDSKAFIRVLINVIDINDNEPRFPDHIYNLAFDEDLDVGSVLYKFKAYDSDFGLNSDIRYELILKNADIDEMFHLDEVNGKLSLKKKFNFINRNYWQLKVQAQDRATNEYLRRSTIAIVNIHVNDVNNHSPEVSINFFMMPGVIEPRYFILNDLISNKSNKRSKQDMVFVSNYLPVNTTIGYVFISDRDSSLNGLIENCELNLIDDIVGEHLHKKMPIYLQDINEIEDLNSFNYSSDIQLNVEIQQIIKIHLSYFQRLKREKVYFLQTNFNYLNEFTSIHNQSKISVYQFELKAWDKATKNKLTSFKRFKLITNNFESNNVKNQTDSEQNDETYDYEIDEDYDKFLDQIENDNKMVEYLNVKSIFQIDINENNEFPVVLAKFDLREFDINYKVKYELSLPFSNSQQDSNDNYSSEAFTSMSNNQQHQSQMTRKRVKIIKCSVELIEFLSINPFSGLIYLNKSLDREECSEYLFYIKAIDSIDIRMNTLINLKINVHDVNDNDPIFEKPQYLFYLIENHFVVRNNLTFKIDSSIKVIDLDLNANLAFYIQNIDSSQINAREYFRVNKEKGNVVRLALKKPLEDWRYEKTNFSIRFKLIVYEDEGANNEYAFIHEDLRSNRILTRKSECLIEIYLKKRENLQKSSNKIQPASTLKSFDRSSINITQVADNDYVVSINLDLVESYQQYLPKDNRLKVDLIEVETDSNNNITKIFYSMENIKILELLKDTNDFYGLIKPQNYFDSSEEQKSYTLRVINRSLMTRSKENLYNINKTNGLLNLDLSLKSNITTNLFNNQHQSNKMPFISIVTIKVSELVDDDEGEEASSFYAPLHTNLSIILILVNNQTYNLKNLNVNDLKNFLIQNYNQTSSKGGQEELLQIDQVFATDKIITTTLMNKHLTNNMDTTSNNSSKLNSYSKLFIQFQDKLSNYLFSIKNVNNKNSKNAQYSFVVLIIITLFIFMTFLALFAISIIFSVTSFRFIKNKCFNEKKENDTDDDQTNNNLILIDQKKHLYIEMPSVNDGSNQRKKSLDSNKCQSFSLEDGFCKNPNQDEASLDNSNKKEANETIDQEQINPDEIDESKQANCFSNAQVYTSSKRKPSIHSNKSKAEYLYDSPVMVRKVYESQDSESKKNFAKKFNLEYLLDSESDSESKNNSTTSNKVAKPSPTILKRGESTKSNNSVGSRKKKISFRIANEINEDKVSLSSSAKKLNVDGDDSNYRKIYYSLLDDDDDFILPSENLVAKKTNLHSQSSIVGVEWKNAKCEQEDAIKISTPLSYKKSITQPEEDIWVKKSSVQSPPTPLNAFRSGSIKLDGSEIYL